MVRRVTRIVKAAIAASISHGASTSIPAIGTESASSTPSAARNRSAVRSEIIGTAPSSSHSTYGPRALSTWQAAIRPAPRLPITAKRTAVANRRGRGASSSDTSRMSQSSHSAAGPRRRSALDAIIGPGVWRAAEALDHDDRRRTHPERKLRVGILEDDPHREALRKPHPVERRLDLRQALDGRAVVLIERPADALHHAVETAIRVAQQVDINAHAGPDVGEKIFAEVSQHIPGAIIDQAQHLAAFVGVLADRDV